MAKPIPLQEKKWARAYFLVLIFNAILILVFYILKLAFNI